MTAAYNMTASKSCVQTDLAEWIIDHRHHTYLAFPRLCPEYCNHHTSLWLSDKQADACAGYSTASTSNVNHARFVLVVSSSVVGGQQPRNSSSIDTGRHDSEDSQSVQAWDRDRDDDRLKWGQRRRHQDILTCYVDVKTAPR